MPSSGQVQWRWYDPEWEPEENDSPEYFGVDAPMSGFQLDFIQRNEEPLLILQTGVGAGKTRVAAWAIVLKMLDGWRVLAIAQNSKALKNVLYRDILKILMTIMPDYRPDRYYNKTDGHIGMPPEFGDACCDGGTDENPSGILGYTEYDGVVFDEASRICLEMRNNAEDRNRGKGIVPWVRYLSSPNMEQPEMWFADECQKHPDCVIHATSLDNEFTTEEYKARLKERYVEGSDLYNQQVLGLIVEGDGTDAVFLRAVLQNSMGIPFSDRFAATMYCAVGVDCARFGDDNTVICARFGYWCGDALKVLHGRDSYEISDAIDDFYMLARARRVVVRRENVDMAYGSGVVDVRREKGHRNVNEVGFGDGPADKVHFLNVRAELYFRAKAWFNGGGIIRDEKLAEELRAQRYQIVKENKFKLVDKDIIKDFLGRSPDRSDAFALTFYGGGPKADLVSVSVDEIVSERTGNRGNATRKRVGKKFATR